MLFAIFLIGNDPSRYEFAMTVAADHGGLGISPDPNDAGVRICRLRLADS